MVSAGFLQLGSFVVFKKIMIYCSSDFSKKKEDRLEDKDLIDAIETEVVIAQV